MRISKTRHVVSINDNINAARILFLKPEGKISLENLGLNGRIIIKGVFKDRTLLTGIV